MWSNPISSLDDSAERHTWKKQIVMCLFSTLLSITVQHFEGSLLGQVLASVSKRRSKTYTSSKGNLCPFAHLMSTNMEPNPQCKHKGLPVVTSATRSFALSLFLFDIEALSSVHPPILFPQAGTEPVWAINTLGITSGEPTQLINRERVIAGKRER